MAHTWRNFLSITTISLLAATVATAQWEKISSLAGNGIVTFSA